VAFNVGNNQEIKSKLIFKLVRIKAQNQYLFDRFIRRLPLKMMCLDLDGTALNDSKQIVPENLEALNKVRQNNKNLMANIVTGRGYHQAKRFAEEMKATYFSTDNGGAIFERKGEGYELIESSKMKEEDCLLVFNKVLGYSKENQDMIYHLSTPEEFIIGEGEENFKKAHDTFYPGEVFGDGVVQVGSLEKIQKQGLGKNIIKMCVDFREGKVGKQQFNDFEGFLKEKNIDYFKTSDSKIEIAPKGVSKCSAIEKILKIEEEKGNSIEKRQVLTIGDSDNDMPMFKGGFQSFCPSNAKEKFKRTLPGNVRILKSDNNGELIKEALDKFGGVIEPVDRSFKPSEAAKTVKNMITRPRCTLGEMNKRNVGRDNGPSR